MQVEAIDEPGAEWDAFVESTPGPTLAHAAAWARVLREAYGLTPRYLAARDRSGALAGVLPLMRFRTLSGGRELVSMPFLDTGGILALRCDAEAALLDAALALTRETGARALELRQREPLAAAPSGPVPDRVDFTLPLEADEPAQWKALPAKVRNQTRKAEREGLRIAAGTPDELLRGFYQPFRVNMRDLGSPVHAERFFRAAARHFGARLRFIVATLGERPVGGLVAIRYANVVSVPWASTLRSERHRCPNNLIYWEALRWAVGEGTRAFDFGRSPPNSGSYRFKLGWGAREHPLAWKRLDPHGSPLDLSGAGEHAVLRRLARLWTRLPLPITVLVGPRIRRHLSA